MNTPLATYGAIILALLTFVGGLIAYFFQKRLDRRNQLIELRRAAYRSYLAAFINQIGAPTPESLIALQKCEFDLFVIASDNVVQKLGVFSNYSSETSYANLKNRDPKHYKSLLVDALLAMRRDCFEKSRMSREQAFQLIPMQ